MRHSNIQPLCVLFNRYSVTFILVLYVPILDVSSIYIVSTFTYKVSTSSSDRSLLSVIILLQVARGSIPYVWATIRLLFIQEEQSTENNWCQQTHPLLVPCVGRSTPHPPSAISEHQNRVKEHQMGLEGHPTNRKPDSSIMRPSSTRRPVFVHPACI